MHISDVRQILFVFTSDTYRVFPFVYKFKYTIHWRWWKSRRSFWEPPYKLIEKVFRRDL